ncbi:MAG: hypothetical protein IT165_06685 [Bryobacterales bacterium]|nr:hypothetical protein [Bryobacterales bacterium]
MQLVLSNAQGELAPLERGMHALAATEKGRMNGRSVKAYAEQIGRPPRSVEQEVCAARVVCAVVEQVQSVTRTYGLEDFCEVGAMRQLAEIHAAPEPCWARLGQRMLEEGWTIEQTKAVVKSILAIRPPRGYEKLFAIEKIQEIAATGQDPNAVTKLSIRAIERARADIRDVQFAVLLSPLTCFHIVFTM